MIDVHCHILPGLDDGSKDLDTSLMMCKMAADDGIEAMVCTPHANERYAYDPDLVGQKIAELSARTGGVPKLYQGCDFHLSYENIQSALEDGSRYTINRGIYLLVEFADLSIPPNITDVFYRLQSRGIVPVITHPERNAWIIGQRDALAKWVETGCRVQITAHSLLGRFGKESARFCDWLLERGLVHFVASDSHNVTGRPPLLGAACRQIAATYGSTTADALFRDNPRAALESGAVEAPLPEKPESRGLLSRIAAAFRSR